MPCSARLDVTGLASFAYSDSAAWAIAFIPETSDIAGGRPYVDSTSYTITSRRTRIERMVDFVLPRLAEHRRCLRAGIGGRKHDLREVRSRRKCFGEAYRRAATESDDAIGVEAESFSMTRSVASAGMCMTASVERWTPRSPRTLIERAAAVAAWCGSEGTSPLAIQRNQLVSHLSRWCRSEKDASRQCRIFKGFNAFPPRAHVPTFVSRANSSIIASRIANFWTLPVTVEGKFSPNRMYRGTL